MEDELNNLFSDIDNPSINELFGYFFKKSGKYLRPALVFLSAEAVRNHQSNIKKDQLIQLALALELVHSASLVHDDIIDKDLIRRGQKTLNNVFGNKTAVLAGDALYALAYSIVSTLLPKEFAMSVSKLSFKMCVAEIEQANGNLDRERYFNIIKGKTALFTSMCCKLGAILAGANENEVESLESFGLNFGMAYQIKDDYMDDDPNALNNVTLAVAEEFANKARQSIYELEDSIYKQKLCELMDYVMGTDK